MFIRKAILVLLLLGPYGLALAGAQINERRPLKPDARVTVVNVSGGVEVQAWDRSELQVTGELGDGTERLEITGSDGDLRIEVRIAKDARNVGDSYLNLHVPAGTALVVEAVSADVAVQGVKGPVEAQSVSGDVNLHVGSAKVAAQSVSGDLNVRAPAAETRLQSVSGDIAAEGMSGRIAGETVSGNFSLKAGSVVSLQAKTVSGDLDLDFKPTESASVKGESLSGEIQLRLPANASATVTMQTFSGECEDDPAEESVKKKEVKLGKGGARIELSTFSGDIRLLKDQ